MNQNRRIFLKNAVLTGSAFLVADKTGMPQVMAQTVRPVRQVDVFVNQYTVSTFYEREGINFTENQNRCLAELKEAGFAGIELFIGRPEEVEAYAVALKKHDLLLRSIYISANLHDEAVDSAEIKRVIAVAEKAKPAGTQVIVLNPQAKSGKSDAELDRQNQNLNVLGASLRQLGMLFAIHYHITELEFAAREFHSFMTETNPDYVSLCYDTHWSFRASGHSAVSAYSHAKLYAGRIAELHLRQSKNGVWTETFVGQGDIDYRKTIAILRKSKGFNACHVVLEQAPEKGTPQTLKPIDIFKKSILEVKKLFVE